MKTVMIQILSTADVKQLVKIAGEYPFDIDLLSDRYVIDAKSIMGIFSLDLHKPIKMEIHSDDCEELILKLDKYIVK